MGYFYTMTPSLDAPKEVGLDPPDLMNWYKARYPPGMTGPQRQRFLTDMLKQWCCAHASRAWPASERKRWCLDRIPPFPPPGSTEDQKKAWFIEKISDAKGPASLHWKGLTDEQRTRATAENMKYAYFFSAADHCQLDYNLTTKLGDERATPPPSELPGPRPQPVKEGGDACCIIL